MKQNSFTRKERLKKNSSIKHVFDNGTAFKARLITVFLLKRALGPGVTRAAFIIPRKSLPRTFKGKVRGKKAVLRNRLKRLLREAYRNTKHLLPHTYDIVILGTKIRKHTKSFVVEEDLANVFRGLSKK